MSSALLATDRIAMLQPWRDAGVLDAADVHIAVTLARLGGLTDSEADRLVMLGAALACRGPRHGHVCVDLLTIHDSVGAETELDDDDSAGAIDALEWPDTAAWQAALVDSALVEVVGTAVPDGPERPLVLDGTLLYLARYRQYETQVVDSLLARASVPPAPLPVSDARRDELFAALAPQHEQPAAAINGACRPLSIIVGGPGTGKTHTVATMLALLLDQAPEQFRVALVAPTGKAAARMGESIARAANELRATGIDGADRLADRMSSAEPSTVHTLLGYNPGRATYRHDASDPLVHDVVIVDETSMVSLPMMARLLDAVRPDARVVLVGDPGQLASVEAGSVLSDIAGALVDTPDLAPTGPLRDCITVLRFSYRFPADSPIGRFATAVRVGDADAALEILGSDSQTSGEVKLEWHPESAISRSAPALIEAIAAPTTFRLHDLAAAGDDEGALAVLDRLRVLCAHRRGPYGVARWNRQFEEWLTARGVRTRDFYVGRPILVTANDRTRHLFNGDLGVVVESDGVERVVFREATGIRAVPPSQLESVETVHAMTIHKSQGSEFGQVVVIMPPGDSRLATCELLYTAVTRATTTVTIIGTPDSIRAAIERRVTRASGLGARLWSA